MHPIRISTLASLLALLLLTGCGGGSSATSDGTDPMDPNAEPPASSAALGGRITISAGVQPDSDTGDPAQATSNNSFATAQAIFNPGTVIGFVSTRSGFNPETGGFYPNDDIDLFVVNVSDGQKATLVTTESLNGSSHSITALNADGSSANVEVRGAGTNSQTIIFADEQTVYLAVTPGGPGGLYQLSLGQSNAAVAPASALAAPDMDFEPDEVLIGFKSQSNAATKQRQGLRSAAVANNDASRNTIDALGMRLVTQLGSTMGHYAIDDAAQIPGFSAAMQAQPQRRSAMSAEAQQKAATWTAIQQLRKHPDIAFAEPNYRRRALFEPNDEFFGFQWHYAQIKLPQAWDAVRNGSLNETWVAVIDSGIRGSHQDFNAVTVPGFDFVDNDNDPTDVGEASTGQPVYHGSHVAGTVAARGNNGVGVSGVGGVPDGTGQLPVKVMSLRVLGDDGLGLDSDIVNAVLYAARLSNSSGQLPSRAVDVINLSLGGSANSAALSNAIQQAREAGIIVVGAAGNENTSEPSFPAANSGVVSVSAVGQSGALASYSNFGSTIDVAAPGGEMSQDEDGDGYPDGVLSTWDDPDEYVFLQGTSMAAPHVAGVAALLKAFDPSVTPALFDQWLADGVLTTDVGASGRDDQFGHGLINAAKAINAVASEGALQPQLLVSPNSLNFGAFESNKTFDVDVFGDDSGVITGITSNQSFIQVSAENVDGFGQGTYRVDFDRSDLAISNYTAVLTINSTIGEKTVNVIAQVVDPSLVADAGRHYLLLLQQLEETAEIVVLQQLILEAENGQYAYGFPDLSNGEYFIAAGTDMDNDGFICDIGEACGEFPVRAEPGAITVAGFDLNNVDFATSINSLTTQLAVSPDSTLKRAPITGYRRLIE